MRRVVPLTDNPRPLNTVQHVNPIHRPLRRTHHRTQHPHEPLNKQLHRTHIEQIPGKRQRALQPGRRAAVTDGLGQRERQVEPRRQVTRRHRLHLKARQIQHRPGIVLQGQHHLKQRVARHRTRRRQVLHQTLERHVLMRERTQVGLAHPTQQLHERRRARHVRPQDKGVDEEPDQVVQGLVRASRHGRADRDVRPRTQTRQQHRQRGLQHHEHRHTLSTSQADQPLVQLSRDREADRPTPVASHRRTQPIHRKHQLLRHTRQHPTPVSQLLRQNTPRISRITQQPTLPQRIIPVLHRQRRPPRHRTRRTRRIRNRHIPRQRTQRPTITRNVMHHYQQDVLLRCRPEEPRPQRQLHRQVEGMPGRRGHELRNGRCVQPLGIHYRQQRTHLVQVQHVLGRTAVDGLVDGTQYLVPTDHVPESLTQCFGVQST